MPMPQPTAITIGNFDGVHLGHVQLIQAAKQAAGPDGRVVALAFDPHPSAVLRPQSVPARLSTWQQRSDWLRAAGASQVIQLNPTRDFLNQTAREFLASIVREYSPICIVEGPDFQFGKNRSGTVDTLREFEGEFNYRTIIIPPIDAPLTDQSLVRVNSSMIRWLLVQGRVRVAAQLLGRPYELISMVARGDQRGRSIGVPTINLARPECLLPADGIYAGLATLPGGPTFPAAISVGTKPTFGQHPRVCEAHLIDYEGPLDHYGWTVRLEFHEWIRDQLTYTGIDPLVRQLHRDIHRVKEVEFARAPENRPGASRTSQANAFAHPSMCV